MRCRFIYDKKTQTRVLISECYGTIHKNNLLDCYCEIDKYKNQKKNMEISEKEYNELKSKAAKWDSLDAKISSVYNGEQDSEDEEAGLDVIGEIAAYAFGYM